jgi:isocitrate/isopropylmalate dehydrogenase
VLHVCSNFPVDGMISSDSQLRAAYYNRTGEILSAELIEECKKSDAVLLAAIGMPEVRLPDGTEVQTHQVVGLRKALDLYIDAMSLYMVHAPWN